MHSLFIEKSLFIYHLFFCLEKGKGKVVYGQEPPSGESTTTECEFNYQLLAVITEVAQWGAPIVAVNHNQLRTMASVADDINDDSLSLQRLNATGMF